MIYFWLNLIFRSKKKRRLFTLQGHRRKRPSTKEMTGSSLSGSRRKLDFMLIYLKGNMNQSLLADRFKISQSKVSQWFTFLLSVLELSLEKLGVSPEFGMNYIHQNKADSHLLADVTERPIPRKTCYKAQQEDYSGKSHMHAEKNFAICDSTGKILFISYSFSGSTHDKTIYDELSIDVGDTPLLLDLGFQGIAENGGIMIPFKKPKGGQLTKVKKQLNQAMSSLRVKVEHAFSGLKRLKMIGEKLRIPSYQKRQVILKIAAAIHNLRVTRRKPLIIHS